MAEILIIGGTGSIGSVVSNYMISRGEKVYSVSRNAVSAIAKCDKVTYLYCDRRNREVLHEMLKGISADVILDFAAYSGEDFVNLIDLIPSSVKCYLVMSSIAVASSSENGTAGEVVLERPYISAQPISKYVDGKKSLEAEVLRYLGELPQHRVVIMRTGEIIGVGDNREFYFFYRWYRHQKSIIMPDGGSNLVHPVDARDLVQAIYQIAMTSEVPSGIYQIAGARALPMKQLVTALFEACEKRDIRLINVSTNDIREWFPDFYYPYFPRSTVIDTSNSQKYLHFAPTYDVVQSFLQSREIFEKAILLLGEQYIEGILNAGKFRGAISLEAERFLLKKYQGWIGN